MESDIQRDILEKLTRYGDSLLGESNETKASSRLTASQQSTTQRKKTKKKKQTKNKTPTEAGQKQINERSTNSKHNSMKEFEEELRMFKESRARLSSEGAGELKERKEDGMRIKKRKAPEVIVFEDPTKRKRHRMKSMAVEGGEKGAQSEEEVELDQARHEVWKLGISGMDYRDRERQEAAKAIQLGAKPPRKDYVNYKELIEAQKHKKQEEREQRELNGQMGVKVSKRKEEKVQLQNKGFWTDKTQKKGVYIDGQLGKYKRGVQVIAKRDLAKMKSSRGKGNKR